MQSSDIPRWLEYANGDPNELEVFIEEGEHQRQDFKFRVDSSRKIARSLSAFANTNGGRLLIGVKDNGTISGIDPEEEFHMIEGAAEVYSKPSVDFSTTVYQMEEKLVLRIDIPPSINKPHYVKEEDGKWMAYIRQDDNNHQVNRVIINYLKDKNPENSKKNLVTYGPQEKLLFEYLTKEKDISLSKFARISKTSITQAEKVLALFLKWGILKFNATDKGIRFELVVED
jgi:predicted HTH transcriptional regulator